MKRIFLLLFVIAIALTSCESTSRLIELGNYTGYEYVYNDPEPIDEEEKQEFIWREYCMTYAERYDITDRTAINEGDFVIADYTTYVDGEPYGTGNNETFKVGANFYLPDLERQLIGKEINTEYTIIVAMPEDYQVLELAGKDVQFDITVKNLYNYYIPDDKMDEFITENGYSSYEEYYDQLCYNEIYSHNYYERKRVCNDLIKQIADDSKFKISDSELEEEYKNVLDTYHDIAGVYELELEDYVISMLEFENMDDFYAQCRVEAADNIKAELVKEKLIEVARIEFTDEEMVDIAVTSMNIDEGNVYDIYDQLRGMVTEKLLFDFILENSVRVN